jgi:hypothetical protein
MRVWRTEFSAEMDQAKKKTLKSRQKQPPSPCGRRFSRPVQ